VLIVQHMPPMFTAELSTRLAAQTGLDVAEAVDGETVRPGVVRIAPGGLHMLVTGRASAARLRLDAATPVHSVRPAVDPLFTTAAAVYGDRVLGVILTGMGVDGTQGARAIVDAGGEVIAQDEATSVVWGMPGSVVNAGLACEELPLDRIGHAVRRHIHTPGAVAHAS
jgi:two-component system chemotaxis response regulator CheB